MIRLACNVSPQDKLTAYKTSGGVDHQPLITLVSESLKSKVSVMLDKEQALMLVGELVYFINGYDHNQM